MRALLFLLCILMCACQQHVHQSDDIVRELPKQEVVTPIKDDGPVTDAVKIRRRDKVKLSSLDGFLRGWVTEEQESRLHAQEITPVEIDGVQSLRLRFAGHEQAVFLPIKKRYKSGRVGVEAVISINQKSAKGLFIVDLEKKDWDISLGRKIVELNYIVAGGE